MKGLMKIILCKVKIFESLHRESIENWKKKQQGKTKTKNNKKYQQLENSK